MGYQRIPDLSNQSDVEARERSYESALEDMTSFLNENEDGVGILDASSTTHALRASIRNKVISSHSLSPYHTMI